MKRLLATLCLLGIGAGVYFFFFSIPPGTIVLRDDGFHPRILNIQAGETVTFKNERGKYFWPASDFHPTHALFPAFDPKEPVAPEDTWSFTFEKPGVYKYHDHLAAYYFGVITVADEQGNVPNNCMEQGGTYECWQNEVYLALAERGVDAAYDTVARLFVEEPGFAESCHGIAHNIGLASYQFYRTNPNFIYSPKAIVCAAGFYHGFMEGYLGANEDVVGSARVCDEIGKRLGAETPDARLQCYHGIGHGAVETAVAESGAFGARDEFVGTAVALCEEATLGVAERYRCVSGTYNGVANLYINGAYGLSVEAENPLLMCAAQKEEYKEACYGNMNSVVLWAADNDFSTASRAFLVIPDEAHKNASIEYLADLYAVTHLDEASFGGVLAECRNLPGTYRLSCVRGFTLGLLEHGNPGSEYEAALTFCRMPSLREDEVDACLTSALRDIDTWYSVEQARSICEGVSPKERLYCPE